MLYAILISKNNILIIFRIVRYIRRGIVRKNKNEYNSIDDEIVRHIMQLSASSQEVTASAEEAVSINKENKKRATETKEV